MTKERTPIPSKSPKGTKLVTEGVSPKPKGALKPKPPPAPLPNKSG